MIALLGTDIWLCSLDWCFAPCCFFFFLWFVEGMVAVCFLVENSGTLVAVSTGGSRENVFLGIRS